MSETASPAVPEATQPQATEGALPHKQIMLVIYGLMLGMLLAALDMTIMGTATKTIADQLHGQTIQAWVTTAYLITSTIATPLYGKLSDIYGRKPMYLTAISLFLIGSVLSGIANSMYELAAYRADARMDGKITFGMNAVIEEGFERRLDIGTRGSATIRFE